MLTSKGLLSQWTQRYTHIVIDTVTLNEAEVMYTAEVLDCLPECDGWYLREGQVLTRCKQCYRNGFSHKFCADSLMMMNETYKNIL